MSSHAFASSSSTAPTSKPKRAFDTRRLGEALCKMGVTCETRLYEMGHHAFHAFVLFPNAKRCWLDTFEFLGRYIEGQRTPVPLRPQ